MKKYWTILVCLGLSACYYTVPESEYYVDETYVQPDYYSQTTTYVTPASSYTYVSEQKTYIQPKVIYVDDKPNHHATHSPRHEYYYPKNQHHDKKHKAEKPRPGRGGPEKITILHDNEHKIHNNDKVKKPLHEHNNAKVKKPLHEHNNDKVKKTHHEHNKPEKIASKQEGEHTKHLKKNFKKSH